MLGADVADIDRPASALATTVVHLITTLTQGGAERVLSQVVPRPDEHPDERHVVITLVPGGMFADELTGAGVEVRDLGMRPGRDAVRGTLRLARLLRELDPVMVISWMYHASLLDLLARPLAGHARRARMVWMLRGSLSTVGAMPRHTRGVLRLLARRSSRPDLVVTNSLAGREQHAEFGLRPRRWLLLPNGCDTDRFAPVPDARAMVRRTLGIADDELAVLFVGRNHPDKGYDLLLEALPRLEEEPRRSVMILVGSGTQQDPDAEEQAGTEAETQAARGCRVMHLGERQDVPDLMRASDALVLPSRSEGTPNAVIEAMATGLPCAVTDVGDSADVVGPTGIVIPTATVEAVAEGLGALLAMDDAQRRKLGLAARQRVADRYSLDTSRELYRALWNEPGR